MHNDRVSCHIVIPARFNSSRLMGKPLVELAGQPMIVRVHSNAVSAAKMVDFHCDATVATDDARIAEVLEARDIPFVMTDPQHQSGTDRVAEVARRRGWGEADVVINLQGDEPLFGPTLIAQFLRFCVSHAKPSVFTACVPLPRPEDYRLPNAVKVVRNSKGAALLFSRAPIPEAREADNVARAVSAARLHIGVYGYHNTVLQEICAEPQCEIELLEGLEQLRFLWMGLPIQVLELDRAPGKGVDTTEDVKLVNKILAREEIKNGKL